MLDGDEMRCSVSEDLGFSKDDRVKHNIRIAKLAAILAKDVNVIVSLITPFEDLRQIITKIAQPIWIYIEKNVEISKERPFEIPRHYHIKVNSDKQTVDEQVNIILDYLSLKKHKKLLGSLEKK